MNIIADPKASNASRMPARSGGAALRIAMVTTFYPPYNFGGDGIYVQRLARALVARGHHVEVIHDTDGYRALAGEPGSARAADDGITVHRLGSRMPKLSSLAVQQFGTPCMHAARLRELLTDRFDVIHFHNISLVGGPGVWKFGTGVKLHTAHEHWMVCPTHILWRDNKELCDERRCLSCTIKHRRPPQLWRYSNQLSREARHVDRFLTLSASAVDNHKRFGFGAPIEAFPSFLPESESAMSRDPKLALDRPYFLFVGRLEVIKGLQDIIPEFDADLPADLLIAGSGSYEPELRRLAAGRANVRFLGQKTADELRMLYRNARAALTPSRCYEVFPLVVLEAFRDATPIVARDLGPYPEILAQSSAGRLFRTSAELRQSLIDYATNEAAATEDGERGRAAFERLWSEDVVIARYMNLIADCADLRSMTELCVRARSAAMVPAFAD